MSRARRKPHAQGASPFAPEVLADPTAAYPVWLGHHPVYRCGDFDPPFYVLSRHADLAAMAGYLRGQIREARRPDAPDHLISALVGAASDETAWPTTRSSAC